jgi:cell division protein FtsZ
MSIEMIETSDFQSGTQIKVIGVGGGGGNAVNHMIERQVQGVEFICANTDAQALSRSLAVNTIHLGASGLGAGGKPEKGREAAEAAADDIRQAIRGADMLFITAGMGGGTGTGAAPVIARIARDMGILTVGVVTKPFNFEGGRRMNNAEAGLAELEANVDSLVVVLNQKLLDMSDDLTQVEAFAQADDVLKNAVGGIAEIINDYGNVNVDFEDVRTVMSAPGKAMMGTATASGPDRARLAAEQAVACPLLEGVDLAGAKGVLVLVTASRASLRLKESEDAMNTILACASIEAETFYGAAYDDALGDDIRVTVLATGLSRPGAAARRPITVVQGGSGQRTGTDDVPFSMAALNQQSGGRVFNATSRDYVPSVWRRPDRTQATVQVDALASGGMEDIEIPAFLRKQAD